MRTASSLIDALVTMPPGDATALLRAMHPADQRALERNWAAWGRTAQRPPPGDWRVWLMMAGRGFGKTRAGAEWVQKIALSVHGARIALVAATMDEARAIMVEGESGLLSLGSRKVRPKWEPSLGRLRGPQHRFAWCDELAKWPRGIETWDNLMLGLRDGVDQRVLVTTTPRACPLLKRLIADPKTVRTGGGTTENMFLSPAYIESVRAAYAGTRLGRQELDGELIDDAEGALWTRALIETCRVSAAPELVRVVVGVDPPAGTVTGTASGKGGDACGIVVCGLGRDGTGYVIEDASVAARSPQGWALAVAVAAARHGADRVVAEANNGGKMVEAVLRAADSGLPVKLVHASRGKAARAEPVALRYEAGKVRHLGAFPELEDELCGLISGGGYEGPGRSPDRADACVWALTELMLGKQNRGPRVRQL